MNYIRTFKQIFLDKMTAVVNQYKIGKTETTLEFPIMFIEGIISIKSNGKASVQCAENFTYSIPINKTIPSSYEVGNTLIYEANNPNNYLLLKDGNLIINTQKILFNNIEISIDNSKLKINNKEVAVVGGTILNNTINTSGQ